jgi:hypothetical protein
MRTEKQWAPFAATIMAALFAATIVLGAPGDKADIQIELPALAGDYHIGNSTQSQDPTGRTTTFALPDSVVGVGLMRLIISATWHMGVVELTRQDFPAMPDTFRWVIPLQMEISAPSLGECYLFSYAGGQEGYWIDSDYFYPECPSGDLRASDLVGLDLSVNFYCRFDEQPGKRLIEDAFGTVHSVSVELQSAVPNEDTTWGAVKALYR